MQDRQIHLTKENDDYISLLWRIAGIDVNGIINAAIDAKRKSDAALLADINALTERVKKHLSGEPEEEKPKRKGGRPRKSVNQFVEEVHQADKMSKDEFVEYFGGKG